MTVALDYLLVGSPRSGTGYSSQVLNSLGVATGHESVFRPSGACLGAITELGIRADSSWLAAPYLSEACLSGTKLVHIVRNPYAVVASLRHIKLLHSGSDCVYTKFAYQHVPSVLNIADPMARALVFYTHWNRMITRYACTRFNVEGPAEALAAALDIPCVKGDLFSNRTYNTRKSPSYCPVIAEDLAHLPRDIVEPFNELVEEFGYSIE